MYEYVCAHARARAAGRGTQVKVCLRACAYDGGMYVCRVCVCVCVCVCRVVCVMCDALATIYSE